MFLLLAVTVLQASTEFVQPAFIEDVIKKESESQDIANRIVSGWDALPGQHPHQAALRLVDAAGGVSACGGSIVHREWVITAAHCTAQRVTVVVRGGVVHLTQPEYIFETKEWWNHPTYNDLLVTVVQPNDISIVKLQRPMVYTRNLRAIRIQSSADAFRNYEGERVHASGHGRTWTGSATTEMLQWVYLLAVSNPTCMSTYGSLITANSICAKWYNVTSQSTCQGDSGGPLVHVGSDGVETLIGVTSFVAGGNWGCHSGLEAGFIRPGPFLSWFEEVSGIDFENLEEDEEVTEPTPPEEDSGEEDDNEEEDDSDSGEDDSSESDEDLSEIMKRLQVKVKVKVTINKFKKHKKVVEKIKAKKH